MLETPPAHIAQFDKYYALTLSKILVSSGAIKLHEY